MSLKDDLESCAYHEAGHAVAAYEFGWYLRHGGVRIGKNAKARLRTPDELRTPEAEIVVTLAGWVADAKYCGVKAWLLTTRSLTGSKTSDEIRKRAIASHRSTIHTTSHGRSLRRTRTSATAASIKWFGDTSATLQRCSPSHESGQRLSAWPRHCCAGGS